MKTLMVALLFALASLVSSAAPAATVRNGWPTNVVYATADQSGNTGTYACTANDVPYKCCDGAGDNGTCATTLNGADICEALEDCEAAGGCLLKLVQGTYEEAEFRIYGTPYWTYGAAKPCGGNYTNGFSVGLHIQGSGIGQTILQSSVPPRYGGGADIDHSAIVTLAAVTGMGLSGSELPEIQLSDLTLDGQSPLQGAPEVMLGTSLIEGIATYSRSNDYASQEPLPYIRVARVRFQNLTHSGYSTGTNNYGDPTQVKIDNGSTTITASEFTKIGCHQSTDGTTAQSPCGCDSGQPDCYDWDLRPTINPSVQPGYKLIGNGFVAGIVSHTLVSRSNFSYITKSNGALGGNCPFLAGPNEFHPGRCGTGLRFHRNVFDRIGAMDIDFNGGMSIEVTNNTFGGTKFDPNWGDDVGGDFSPAAAWVRKIRVVDNVHLGSQRRRQLKLLTWQPLAGEAGPAYRDSPIIVQGEQLELSCAHCDDPNQNCVAIDVSAEKKKGSLGCTSGAPPTPWPCCTGNGTGTCLEGFTGDIRELRLIDNVVVDDVAGNNCVTGLAAQLYERAPGVPSLRYVQKLVIDGGTYTAGGAGVSSDGWGHSAADEPSATYFNYAVVEATGVTVDGGKWTFGRGAGQDEMAGGSCSGFTLTGGASVVDSYGSYGDCQP